MAHRDAKKSITVTCPLCGAVREVQRATLLSNRFHDRCLACSRKKLKEQSSASPAKTRQCLKCGRRFVVTENYFLCESCRRSNERQSDDAYVDGWAQVW
jgi:hypothetical protein